MSDHNRSDSDAVLLDQNQGIVTITLNQPATRNALSSAIIHGIQDALDIAEQRDDVRCVVITGCDGVFSAGGDIQSMEKAADRTATENAEYISGSAHQLIRRIADCSLPIVAKIDGPAFGAGGAIAIACDIRIASENSKIGFGFRQVGLTIDSGVSYFLPRIVGLGTAKTLILTGELLDADEAADIGLYDRVYETKSFDSQADEFIANIAKGPTVALTHSIQLLNFGVERSLDDALCAEATAQANVMDTNDHVEGVTAFFEDRAPDFEGQ